MRVPRLAIRIYLLACLLMALTIGGAWLTVRRAAQGVRLFVPQSVARVHALGATAALAIDLGRQAEDWREACARPLPPQGSEAARLLGRVIAIRRALDDLAADAGAAPVLGALAELDEELRRLGADLGEVLAPPSPPSERAAARRRVLLGAGRAAELSAGARDALRRKAEAAQRSLTDRITSARFQLFFIGASLFLAALGFTVRTVRKVIGRLRGVREVMGAAAAGDLTRRPVLNRSSVPDEIDALAETVCHTIDAQRAMVERIAAASTSLNGTAAALYEEATRQQEAVSGQSERMVEVSATLSSLLGNSARIAGSALGVLDAAERSNAMADVTARRIAELNSHTQRIEDLLSIIQEVSERSDILALNASLEATRAGASGAAFALVAKEMRRLAERVAASVQDVKLLLTDVRASGASTVLATEEGRLLAQGTAASSREISAVTAEQRGAMEQLSLAMNGVSSLVSDAVTRGSHLRGSAEALRQQADQLAAAVGKFLLDPAFVPAPGARGAAPRRRPRGYEGTGHETIGSDILSVLDAVEDPASIIGPEWAQRLAAVRPDGWYPIADLLELMELLSERVGHSGLRSLGRKLFLRSHEAAARGRIRSARDVAYGIDVLYHRANRGQRIGGWRVVRFEQGRAEIEKTTPHHCQMEEGILLQALTMVGVPATIEQVQCFRRGGELCHFVIRSSITDRRWSGATDAPALAAP